MKTARELRGRDHLGLRFWCTVLVLAIVSTHAIAQERILSDDIQARLLADGRLDVIERIHVRAEGRQIRHGITREIPTRYTDPRGKRVVIGVEIIELQRDGRTEPWQRISRADRVRVQFGDDHYLAAPSEPVYTLRYRLTRQVAFLASHDQLFWPAIGPDHALPIERASVRVTLPAAVPLDRMQAEAFTAADGAAGRGYQVALSASGNATWALTRPLPPGQGLTVGLSFPTGLVTPPTRQQTLRWRLRDNLGLLIACAGLLVLIGYCVLRWRLQRRDPATGSIRLHDAPPAGFSPGGLRYIRRMRYDDRCFSSDVLASGVDDHLRITREKDTPHTRWRISRTRAGANTLPTMEQRALLTTLLPGERDSFRLERQEAARIRQAKDAHHTALRRRFQPAMFRLNGSSILLAIAIALLSGSAAIAVSAAGGVLPATLLLVALMLPVLVVFAVLIKAPTPNGRDVLDHIEGLRRYLSVADTPKSRDLRTSNNATPALDATRYEYLLPYAVALDVEEAWTQKFSAAVGAAAATATVAGFPWYSGIPVTDVGKFTRSIGSSLSRRVAAASRPPGRR